MAVRKEDFGKRKYGNRNGSSSSGVCELPVKGQTVNIIGFVGYIISVATARLDHCNMKTFADST